jgi:4-hydroxythreonine-4-phosphate dehydrogenase
VTGRPRLAVTLGDPRGIGPEVVRAALHDALPIDITVIGPDELIADCSASRKLGTGRWHGGSGAEPRSPDRMRDAGRHAGAAVERAVELASTGEVEAIVTGPADKAALRSAGYAYPGHTEFLRDLAGAERVAMMLTSDRLRVVLATTHVALRDAIASLDAAMIESVAEVTRTGLRRWFGVAAPRIALCAANPHAGEGGLFGDEDDRILAPAARRADLVGPLPADTVFVRAMRGEFDAVVTPYHDVGMTAIKVASFGEAVNVTLGLPFPRTAPDHGTALDIAGQGRANPGSMAAAIRLAAEIAVRTMHQRRF